MFSLVSPSHMHVLSSHYCTTVRFPAPSLRSGVTKSALLPPPRNAPTTCVWCMPSFPPCQSALLLLRLAQGRTQPFLGGRFTDDNDGGERVPKKMELLVTLSESSLSRRPRCFQNRPPCCSAYFGNLPPPTNQCEKNERCEEPSAEKRCTAV